MVVKKSPGGSWMIVNAINEIAISMGIIAAMRRRTNVVMNWNSVFLENL
jgi:hypothetical protein